MTEHMKVSAIALKFHKLLPYASDSVKTEEDKIWHFYEWLTPELKPYLARHNCRTLEEFVDEAYKQEHGSDYEEG